MTCAEILVEAASAGCADALVLQAELSDVLEKITGSSGRASFDPADAEGPGAVFVIARDRSGAALGCGAYRPLEPGIAELKRMYARPGSTGVGSAILAALEAFARDAGYRELWLETRAVNDRAVHFYERKGYRRIANFGKYAGRPEAVCLAKPLPS